jgi:hypothetical protein
MIFLVLAPYDLYCVFGLLNPTIWNSPFKVHGILVSKFIIKKKYVRRKPTI